MNKDEIFQILDLVFQICPVGEIRNIDSGKPAVFCDYSPHVAWLSIIIYNKGWKEHIKPNYRFCIDCTRASSPEKDLAVKVLNDILNKNEV